MADQQQNAPAPSLLDIIKQLMNPSSWALLRYILVGLGPMLGLFGVAGFSPATINKIVTYAEGFGAIALGIYLLIGVLIPLTALIYGVLSATLKAQVARWKELAKNPAAAGADVQKALVQATAEIAKAPASKEVANAMIAATNSLPQVQSVAVDRATAQAIATPGVVVGR
jgi:hypothetical protein